MQLHMKGAVCLPETQVTGATSHRGPGPAERDHVTMNYSLPTTVVGELSDLIRASSTDLSGFFLQISHRQRFDFQVVCLCGAALHVDASLLII